jgi:hypothetical protein
MFQAFSYTLDIQNTQSPVAVPQIRITLSCHVIGKLQTIDNCAAKTTSYTV